MILSNGEIIRGIENQLFSINPLSGLDPSKPPFNTSAIDLRLGDELLIPKDGLPVTIDLSEGASIGNYLVDSSNHVELTEVHPTFTLNKGKLILARTLEIVDFPLLQSDICYSARVEGKSSLARCGILVHFTAPTIHAGFKGSITLEIINLGANNFALKRGMYICQLIIEEVKGKPIDAPNQFRGQIDPAGSKKL